MSYLASLKIVPQLPMVKGKALWLLFPTDSLSTILLVIILEGYGSIALSIKVPCPVPAELSLHLPDFDLVVPILVAA